VQLGAILRVLLHLDSIVTCLSTTDAARAHLVAQTSDMHMWMTQKLTDNSCSQMNVTYQWMKLKSSPSWMDVCIDWFAVWVQSRCRRTLPLDGIPTRILNCSLMGNCSFEVQICAKGVFSQLFQNRSRGINEELIRFWGNRLDRAAENCAFPWKTSHQKSDRRHVVRLSLHHNYEKRAGNKCQYHNDQFYDEFLYLFASCFFWHTGIS
jgi:hypothetical protein